MYNVLIVDDEPIVIEALKQSYVWDDFGLEVIGDAYNGLEALEWMRKHEIHVLVTDIRMPQMDGIELIRKIKEHGWQPKILIMSGHDDFAYVKEAIRLGVENYLLKPLDKEELLESLSGIASKLEAESRLRSGLAEQKDAFRENVLQRWMNGSLAGAELTEKSQTAGLDLNMNDYRVAVVKISERPGHADKRTDALRVRTLLTEQLGEGALLFFDAADDLVIVLPGSEQERLKALIHSNEALNGVQLFVAIGETQSSLIDAHLSYDSAKQLLGYAFLLQQGSVVDAEEVGKSRKADTLYYQLPIDTVVRLIEAGKENECLEVVQNAIERLKNVELASPVRLKTAIQELLFHISGAVRKAVLHPGSLPEPIRNLYERFAAANHVDDLLAIVYESISYACSLTDAKDGQAKNATVKQILDYVSIHSEQDLSLKTLAYRFNVNASYLGQVFRKETGILFSSYLNHLRIEKAKELLQNTDMKVTDIAAKVGYLEPSHFYKHFKKATGVSPAEYK